MAWILLRLSNYQQVAPLVRTGGSRHTGLAAPPHRNIHVLTIKVYFPFNSKLTEQTMYNKLNASKIIKNIIIIIGLSSS